MEESKKIKNKRRIKNSKGITLIALVITIIVLLILAGVSIAMLTGDNGILTQATNARENTTKAEEEEKIKMAVMGSSVDDNGYVDILDETSFKNELANQFGSQSLDVIANGDGSFIITVEDTQRKYYVNDDKTVINSDNIIEISTAEELESFRDDVNTGNSYEGKAVLLTGDITLSGEWEPIGYYDQATENIRYPDTDTNKPFRGIFDGENHQINGITITSSDEICHGLFGLVIDGTIRNVVIGENNNISGNGRTAGVIGYLYGIKGNVSNCSNYSDITGNSSTAGIVGNISGQHTVYNCRNYGNIITEQGSAGGIVGSSNGTGWLEEFDKYFHKIINCANYGSIDANENNCGGIVGFFNGNVLNSTNKGEIRGNKYVGGIAGQIDGDYVVENCYNISRINGETGVAGIVGGRQSQASKLASMVNCYSIGEITGNYNIGDILGLEEERKESIINCYTKNDTFTASDLGNAFKDDTENENGGYPMLKWE